MGSKGATGGHSLNLTLDIFELQSIKNSQFYFMVVQKLTLDIHELQMKSIKKDLGLFYGSC